MTNIYRVRACTTSSLQPGETFWRSDVLYTGTDRDRALVAYYASEPQDVYQGYGNGARETLIETVNTDEIEDATDPPRMQPISA